MSWQKNEPDAAKRKTLVIITSGGYPAAPGLDFMAAGAVFVVGANAPKATLATGTLTNIRRPLVVADFTVTATDTANDRLTKVAHGLETGDGPIFPKTTAGNLTAGVGYYAIKYDVDQFSLADSLALAYAGTKRDITANVGAMVFEDSAATERGIWGHFEYAAPQAELNHDRPVTEIIVDGVVGGTSFLRMNADGAHQHVEMTPENATSWDVTAEAGYSYGQLVILMARTMLARLVITGTTHTFRLLDDTDDSHHGTVTASGRDPVVVDNAP